MSDAARHNLIVLAIMLVAGGLMSLLAVPFSVRFWPTGAIWAVIAAALIGLSIFTVSVLVSS